MKMIIAGGTCRRKSGRRKVMRIGRGERRHVDILRIEMRGNELRARRQLKRSLRKQKNL
jgi:hypothetical protein